MTPESLKRLAELLHQHYGELNENCFALQEEIRSGTKKNVKVDRRKVKEILAGKDVLLTFAQLELLDNYLTKYHRQRLAALFENPAVLHSLVAGSQVKVLLGSQPRDKEMRT